MRSRLLWASGGLLALSESSSFYPLWKFQSGMGAQSAGVISSFYVTADLHFSKSITGSYQAILLASPKRILVCML